MISQLPGIDFLRQLADAAAVETMQYFRSNMGVENKYDVGFDPVTEGDRRAEAAIRAILDSTYPNDGILGEEYGRKNPDSERIWVIDPIDGTRAFISGLPVWGTLVGLSVEGAAKIGFMHQPYTDEFYVADGENCYLVEKGGAPQKLETRKNDNIEQAVLFTTSPGLYEEAEQDSYKRLESTVRLARYGADCYGAAMVASGHADIFIEPGLQPYDIVALIPLIEQAGGIVTTVDGRAAENGGTIIGAANQTIYEAALSVFNGR